MWPPLAHDDKESKKKEANSMPSALRIGAKRVAAAAVRPAQVAPRRSMHEGQARLLEKRKIFQANPHLHGESGC